jgi:hypothetical protein
MDRVECLRNSGGRIIGKPKMTVNRSLPPIVVPNMKILRNLCVSLCLVC